MPVYRKGRTAGDCYFFTVRLWERRGNDLLVSHLEQLRASVGKIKQRKPFRIEGWVVLPNHLHCIWRLPQGDEDFSTRWRLIRSDFSRAVTPGGRRSRLRSMRGEVGVWRRPLWAHQICDAEDFRRHLDYLHFNPVKHGYVQQASEWPHSSFHYLAARGLYVPDWSGAGLDDLPAGE